MSKNVLKGMKSLKVLKEWFFTPFCYVAFLAPLLQLVVSNSFGQLYGDEIKYAIINTMIPWFASLIACLVFMRSSTREARELLVVYPIVTLIVVVMCSDRMGNVDGLFTVKGWKSFEYTPVERVLVVEHDNMNFLFPSLRKFENGGYIMKKETETGMFSKYYACPKQVDNDSCIELSS